MSIWRLVQNLPSQRLGKELARANMPTQHGMHDANLHSTAHSSMLCYEMPAQGLARVDVEHHNGHVERRAHLAWGTVVP